MTGAGAWNLCLRAPCLSDVELPVALVDWQRGVRSDAAAGAAGDLADAPARCRRLSERSSRCKNSNAVSSAFVPSSTRRLWACCSATPPAVSGARQPAQLRHSGAAPPLQLLAPTRQTRPGSCGVRVCRRARSHGVRLETSCAAQRWLTGVGDCASLHYDGSEQPYHVSVIQDITERRAMRQALHTSEQRRAPCSTTCPVGVLLAHEGQRMVYRNRSLVRITGYT